MESYTAVIADDEPSVLSGLQAIVDWESLGISIIASARDGRQALNLIISRRPDIAIIDIKMPEASGLEVIHGAREAGIGTDFIILSGYDEFSYAKEAIRYGARAYLLKPLDKQELCDELCRICSQRSLSRHVPEQDPMSAYAGSANSFFRDLIDGKILDAEKASKRLLSSQSNLSLDSCYVTVFTTEDPADLLSPGVLDALEKRFTHRGHKFLQYDTRKLIGIFNSSEVTPEETARECLNVLSQKGLPSPLAGIGDTVSRLPECSYSYNRALTALTYRLYDNDLNILDWKLICTEPPRLKLDDVDFLPLIQSIVRGESADIEKYCCDFVDSLLYVPMPPPNYVYSMCYALYSRISSEFSSYTCRDVSEAADPRELYQCPSLTSIRKWLADSFCQLSEFVDAIYGNSEETIPQEEPKDKIIRSAMIFMRDNIHRHIKLKDIADHVHLSPSYFAIYFKNKTGVNLRDYLLKEKMEYARKRLSDPGVSISDVAFDVGYGDYRSFSRAFKNIYGITPSDFQNRKK